MILRGQVLWDTLDTLNSSCSGPSFIYTRICSHPPTRSCLSMTVFSGEGVCPNNFHVCFTERISQCTIQDHLLLHIRIKIVSAISCHAALLVQYSGPYTQAELNIRRNSSKGNVKISQGFFLARSPKPAATCTLIIIIIIIIANNYQIKLHAEELLQLITARNSNDKRIARPRSNSSMTL